MQNTRASAASGNNGMAAGGRVFGDDCGRLTNMPEPVVFTVIMTGTEAPLVTVTGAEGTVHVAKEGAPVHVKVTLALSVGKPPDAVICRL